MSIGLMDDPAAERATTLRDEVILPLFGQCMSDSFSAVVKAALAEQGIIAEASVRPPLLPVSDVASITATVGAAQASLR